MPNRNYVAGRRCEWRVCKAMRALGGVVTRSAGSKGLWDVTAVFPDAVWLIQVKRTTKGGWRDANWRALQKLPLAPNVLACAFVFRRGLSMPQFYEAKA